jgi:hypothetical protein
MCTKPGDLIFERYTSLRQRTGTLADGHDKEKQEMGNPGVMF